MKIQSTQLKPAKLSKAPTSKGGDQLTLPRDKVDLTPVSERPSALSVVFGAAAGGAVGAGLGGLTGVAGIFFGGLADIFLMNTAHAESVNVVGTMVAAGLIGAGVGAAMSGFSSYGKKRDENQIRQFYAANEISRNESPTAELWAQIHDAGWTERETVPEEAKPVLTKILKDLGQRGLESNASSPEEALAKLEKRNLNIAGQKVERMADLQNVDALHGGGFVVLSDQRRTTLNTIGKMSREGFQIGRAGQYGHVTKMDAREAYGQVEFSAADSGGYGLDVKSPNGGGPFAADTPQALTLVHSMDGKGASALPPEAAEAKKLYEKGLRVGSMGDYQVVYSGSAYGNFLRLAQDNEVTHLAHGKKTLAIKTENRSAAFDKLESWGFQESFSAFDDMPSKIKYKDAAQVTSRLVESSGSLEELNSNVKMARELYSDMGGRSGFFSSGKLPDGYLRALDEKLADAT